ncbi:hypothetical protein SALBM311S_04936 [Streptomyces alboniger]
MSLRDQRARQGAVPARGWRQDHGGRGGRRPSQLEDVPAAALAEAERAPHRHRRGERRHRPGRRCGRAPPAAPASSSARSTSSTSTTSSTCAARQRDDRALVPCRAGTSSRTCPRFADYWVGCAGALRTDARFKGVDSSAPRRGRYTIEPHRGARTAWDRSTSPPATSTATAAPTWWSTATRRPPRTAGQPQLLRTRHRERPEHGVRQDPQARLDHRDRRHRRRRLRRHRQRRLLERHRGRRHDGPGRRQGRRRCG